MRPVRMGMVISTAADVAGLRGWRAASTIHNRRA